MKRGRKTPTPGQLVFRPCQFCNAFFVPGRRSTQGYCSQLCQKQDKKLKPPLIARIQEERAKGLGFKAIAKKLAVSVGTAHHYAKSVNSPPAALCSNTAKRSRRL